MPAVSAQGATTKKGQFCQKQQKFSSKGDACTMPDLAESALPEFHLVLEADPEAKSGQLLSSTEKSHIEGLLARYQAEETNSEV